MWLVKNGEHVPRVPPAKNQRKAQHHAVTVKRGKFQALVQSRAVIAALDRRLHHHSQHALTVESTHMPRKRQAVALPVPPTPTPLPKAAMSVPASATPARLDRMVARAPNVAQEATRPRPGQPHVILAEQARSQRQQAR